MGYANYKQYDSRWGRKNYNGSSTMAGAGCGPMACANLLHAVNPSITPITTMRYMQKHKFAIRNQGTAWAGIPACLRAYGLKNVQSVNVNTTMTEVWKYLAKGYCAIFLFRRGSRGGVTWTSSGHFIAVTAYKYKNGKHYLYTRDSGGRGHTGWYAYETTMRGLIPKVWIGIVPSKEPVKKPTSKYTGAYPKPTLKKGSKGNNVKAWQRFLNWYHPAWKLVVDGIFGDKTRSATMAFQKTEHIAVDGIAGKNTIAKARAYESKPKPPSPPSRKGIDVSEHQKKIDWKAVKADGIDNAIIRASYTSIAKFQMYEDSECERNIKEAAVNGVRVGLYHFSQARSIDEAKKEAAYIVKIANRHKDKITLPVAMDYEFNERLTVGKAKELGKKKCTEIIETFCDAIGNAGFTPMIYASYNVFKNYVDFEKLNRKYMIWLAQYNKTADLDYDYWQYSSSGHVNGISGRVDVDKIKESAIPATPPPTRLPADKMIDVINEIAHPYGTPEKTWAYKTGEPTAAYKTALKKYMNHSARISLSDCGYFVSTVVRMAGIDKDFLAFPPGAKSNDWPMSDKFEIVFRGPKVPEGFLKPGDILRYNKTKGRHTMIYYGSGKIAEAGRTHRFPVIRADSKKYNAENVKFKSLEVLRAKN